jgi:hypothetical protein
MFFQNRWLGKQKNPFRREAGQVVWLELMCFHFRPTLQGPVQGGKVPVRPSCRVVIVLRSGTHVLMERRALMQEGNRAPQAT